MLAWSVAGGAVVVGLAVVVAALVADRDREPEPAGDGPAPDDERDPAGAGPAEDGVS